MQKARLFHWLGLVIIATMLTSCSLSLGAAPTATSVPPTPVLPTSIPPTDTPAPPTETPLPTDTPLPTPTPGPIVIDDDFSTDSGRFKCENCVVADGKLTMGPFKMVDSYTPFLAICEECGSFKHFKMSVDTWYESGNSQFGWGLLIRQDEKFTYLLATSSWQYYNVFSFDRSTENKGGRGYKSLIGNWAKGGLSAGRQVNNLEIVMQGSSVSITINGTLIRNLDLPAGSGKVGLWVGNWETSANFDNFHFEELP